MWVCEKSAVVGKAVATIGDRRLVQLTTGVIMGTARIVSLLSGLSLTLSGQTVPLGSAGRQLEDVHVTDRGPHHRVWSKVVWETNQVRGLIARTNSYVELANGLHYTNSASGRLEESNPGFEITADGYAVARRCQHQVVVAPNLNPEDGVVIDLQMPDGQRLRSGVLGLNLFDPKSGRSRQVGMIRDVVGTLVSSNQIVWPDAFEGLRAEVRVRNERGEFHQDVLLRERLSAAQLEQLGFDAATVRLEVWTEFQEAPPPGIETVVVRSETDPSVRAQMLEPDQVDQRLDFGAMRMDAGSGKAFVEPESGNAVRILKEWKEIGGRRFLIESATYEELAPLLDSLPLKTAAVDLESRPGRLLATRTPPTRSRPGASAGERTIQLASAAVNPSVRTVVLDYQLATSQPDVTFRGDTTYFVNGLVNLSGTTTIEGGTVVKFNTYPFCRININGPQLICQTASYRPATFTAKDDDTIGEQIYGSTGDPTGSQYGDGVYYCGQWPGVSPGLDHLHFRHLRTALKLGWEESQMFSLTNAQMVDCTVGIYLVGGGVRLRNCLFHHLNSVFAGPSEDAETYWDGQHLTVDECAYLVNTAKPTLALKNSLLVSITALEGPQVAFASWSVENCPVLPNQSDPGPFFETSGAGSHYLPAGSPYRNYVFTENIDPALLVDLKKKTTEKPQLLSEDITWDRELSRVVERDTYSLDLGYHYDPLDYVVSGRTVSANLTLRGGVAVGVYGGAGTYGLGLVSGNLVSEGTPTALNWIVRYNTVQEQVASSWSTSSAGRSIVRITTAPAVDVRFTGWSVPAGAGIHFTEWYEDSVPSAFSHSEFYGGGFLTFGSTALTNCLWHRVQVMLDSGEETTDAEWYLFNNLFYGGKLDYWTWEETGPLVARNNLFDHTWIYQHEGEIPLVGDYNAYVSGQMRIMPQGGHDVPITSGPTYASASPGLGPWYLAASTPPLSEAGSTTADALGLCPFTTRTDQNREGVSQVDIGYHYVALDTQGNPLDNNINGIPDYDEIPVANPQQLPPVCRDNGNPILLTLTGAGNICAPLEFIIVTGPEHGSLSGLTPIGDTSAQVLYTPPSAQFCGTDSFTFKVRNNSRDSAPAQVTIAIGYANPEANCQEVMTGKNTEITIELSGQTDLVCGGALEFEFVPGFGPVKGRLEPIVSDSPTHATVRYTPDPDTEGFDSFAFTVKECGFVAPFEVVSVWVVSAPILVTSCRQDRILLHWSVPDLPDDFVQDFLIYRCETTGADCEPTEVYHEVTNPNDRFFEDTDVEAGKTYCYRVSFRHQTKCGDVIESPLLSNKACDQVCTPPSVLITGNNAAGDEGFGPISTYNFASGEMLASFVPDGAKHAGANGRGIAIRGAELFYTELSPGLGPSDGIHVAPYGNQGSGGADIPQRFIPNPQPAAGIQDLSFHNNVLYALTGYPDLQPRVFKFNPTTGVQIGLPISIGDPGPASSNSDGFTVLPNGNFLINDGDKGPIYREYDGTTGAYVPPPGGLEVDLTSFGFAFGTGVAVAADGLSLYFIADIESLPISQTLIQTDLSGDLLPLHPFQPINSSEIEDIDVVIP